MKDFFTSLSDGINDFIKSETNGPDAKANFIFGILLVILAITMHVPNMIEEVIRILMGSEASQSSFEKLFVIVFVGLYFAWCVKRLGKINEEKEKRAKLKKAN